MSPLFQRGKMGLKEYDRLWCTNILTELLKWQLTQPFRVPVDPIRDGAKNYLEIVKKPMDLGTVKKKLSDGQYGEVKEFVNDLFLICDDAILFNGENSIFGFVAQDIRKWVEDQWNDKPASLDEEWQKRLETIVAKLHDHVAKAPPPIIAKIPSQNEQ
jgi:hypothetical protein